MVLRSLRQAKFHKVLYGNLQNMELYPLWRMPRVQNRATISATTMRQAMSVSGMGSASALAGFLLCVVAPAFGDTIGPLPGPCAAGSLSSYIALGAAGCSMGHVVFIDFAFSTLAVGGGAIPISPSDVNVTPAQIGENYQLSFSSAGFSVSGSEFVTYLLAYTVDPHPILTFSDDLLTNTPVAPGIVSITTNLCLTAPFAGAVCPGSTASVTVFHDGVTPQTFDSVSFPAVPPITVLGVRNEISLEANGASADFSSLTNTVGFVPEPGSWLLAASALTGILFSRRRRRCGGSAPEAGQSPIQLFPNMR